MIRAGRGVQFRGKFKPGRLNRENGILGPSSKGGVSIPSIKAGALVLLSEDSEEESMVYGKILSCRGNSERAQRYDESIYMRLSQPSDNSGVRSFAYELIRESHG
jgi:hypothetical protein